jgi:phage shock protein PspC (stress-responsive transcriptional regulator)
MTVRTQPVTLLDNPTIPVQIKLAAAWTSFTFLYAYVDILNFYKPGVLDGILDGLVWRFDISATLLTIFLVSVSIPAVMVILSLTLPARVNRAANLVVAALLIPYSAFNAAGATWEWAAFYGISIGIEVLLLAFILRSARTWPRTRSDAAELAPADLPR